MSIKVGINGMGRIGRMIIRSIIENNNKNIVIKHINNRTDPETCSNLLKYDLWKSSARIPQRTAEHRRGRWPNAARRWASAKKSWVESIASSGSKTDESRLLRTHEVVQPVNDAKPKRTRGERWRKTQRCWPAPRLARCLNPPTTQSRWGGPIPERGEWTTGRGLRPARVLRYEVRCRGGGRRKVRQASDRNLTDADIADVKSACEAAAKKLGAELRS